MHDGDGNWITYNGEIYNYLELRRELGEGTFRTTSDTEVVLRAYRRWGPACVERLRGMFAFAIWDEAEEQLFCARDRFGIKPFYYAAARRRLLLRLRGEGAAPAPAGDRDRPRSAQGLPRLPVLPRRQDALQGRARAAARPHADDPATERCTRRRYWEVDYEPDFDHSRGMARPTGSRELVDESVAFHLRSRRPGRRVSLRRPRLEHHDRARSRARSDSDFQAFTGRFADGERYDETPLRAALADERGFRLHEQTIARPTSSRTSATSSTTSTTRSPARARSRSTWSRGSPRST